MWPMIPKGIYCFNYHRIGDENASIFDPNVFSCTAKQFEQHVQFYNKNFIVISIEQLIDKIERNLPIDNKYALITFDDGYIDNYDIAYPILKKYQTPAAFYVATNYLDTPHIPWWDEIAWIIRHTNNTQIKFENWSETVDISSGSITEKVRNILRVIKQDKERTMVDKITELSKICQCEMPDELRKTPLFISWKQAKEMSDNGMHIGSHTMSHTILSHLPPQEQLKEISQSKAIIEQHLSKEVTSIAYPVGGHSAFTETTRQLAQQANYKVAFSFVPGIITSFNSQERFQLKRLPVDGNCKVSQLKNIIVKNT